ncbi:energy transducer TonB [Polluticoccus soli]|uniref:energy transducer TonB n=1 Tax=Polluticoccus soli TaxID=3034150 RepID=UPI0023E184EC|nr:hypothetical protein [Flavipsychrobacter sp. JY13-12]
MKSSLIVVVFALNAIVASAQSQGVINYASNCPDFDYCYNCGDDKAVFLGRLKNYFEQALNMRDVDRIEGVVLVEIAVDSTGKPCARKFINRSSNSAGEIKTLGLDHAIAQMPVWEPAAISGKPINSHVILAFYSHITGHGIFDVNYLRNDADKQWHVINGNRESVITYNEEDAAAN